MPVDRAFGYESLLEDYAHKAKARGVAAEQTSTRTESVLMRDIIAHKATHGALNADELKSCFLKGEVPDCDPDWLARLARVCALQDFFEDDREFARRAFMFANRSLPLKGSHRRFHRLEVELLAEIGNFELAHKIIDQNQDLQRLFHGYLKTDLSNPFLRDGSSDPDGWFKKFNEVVCGFGVRPVGLHSKGSRAFDRLTAPLIIGPVRQDEPLITVVMTTFQPDVEALHTSILSIIQQTWSNWELLIVDDASSSEHYETLKKAEQLDDRIRLIRLERNGGTYLARNVGISHARGEFLTGQDADDWSHPDRLLTQANALIRNPELPGVQGFALKVTEHLVFQRVGYMPFADCAPTLFIRTQLAREVGGYLPARKAADNELRHRISAYVGHEVETIKEPLMFMRILPDSLSRSDFRAGWAHPARRAFSGAYTYWHQHADRQELVLDPQSPPPIPIPRRFQVEDPAPIDLDVVFAGDWRQLGGPQNSMLNEIEALRQKGLRVGVLHLEAARFMSKMAKPMNEKVQALINCGAVTQVLPDDIGTVDLLILRYPPILQFAPHFPVSFQSRRLLIIANQVPSEADNTDIRYIPKQCSDIAERLFGVRGLWAPQGPIARTSLESLLSSEEIADFDVFGIIDSVSWKADRSYFRGDRPVVGRHSRDNFVKWPTRRDDITSAWPIDGSFDVRVMGGAQAALEVLQLGRVPTPWVVFNPEETTVPAFLNSIDFFVYFHHEHWGEAFGRAILESLASGCLAILPQHFEQTFGPAAVYAEPAEVPGLIEQYYNDSGMYREQVERAWQVVEERFSYRGYSQKIIDILKSEPREKGLWY